MTLTTPTLVDLLIIVLASWYVQYILRWLKGPFNIFSWIRYHIFGVVAGGSSSPIVVHRAGFLAEMISCIYCFGFWVGVGVTLLWLVSPIIVIPFAAGAGIVLLETVMQHLSN